MRNQLSRILLTVCALLCLSGQAAQAQTVAPISGLGNIQFFDNNGVLLTNGVLYSFQAGTSTQQATFTDSSGTTQNPNPIPFGSGARVQIWLSIGSFYKFVLCTQNDGAACAAGDILFTVDQVPGGSTSSGGTSSSPFISGSASPATSGILRLATADTICWRNAAGSTNLCISKDANDLLTWAGGSLKLPEIAPPSGVVGFDIIWADNSNHAVMVNSNGGGARQLAVAGNDINLSSSVIQLHFGTTPAPLSGTPPTTGQNLQWNGSAIVGVTPPVPLVANGTAAMTTASIAALNCGAQVTAAATGVVTTDTVTWSYNGDPAANPGILIVVAWPTANVVNFRYCNSNGGAITPFAATLNWRVYR